MSEGDAMGQNIFDQMMQIYVLPEIEKRQKSGKIPKPYTLRGFQILWCTNAQKPIIRLNNEVKAIAHMKLEEGVAIKEGDAIYENQVKKIEKVELIDEDKDCGHVTVFKIKEKFIIHFSFIYDREIAKNLLKSANDYFELAEKDIDIGKYDLCHEHLFCASELAINALLFLIHPDHKRIVKMSKHSAIFSEFSRVNPFKQPHHKVFKKLMHDRADVKYQRKKIDEAKMDELFCEVKAMMEEINAHSKQFYDNQI